MRPPLSHALSFADASAAVVDYLEGQVPMELWSVSRYDGDQQVHLEVRGDFGLERGDSVPWDDSFCKHMAEGTAPGIAPDAMAVPEYAAAAERSNVTVGAYVGMPIRRADGSLFGTLCGLDAHRSTADLARHEDLLRLLSALLATILDADLQKTAQARSLELAELSADTDALTGLLNRRGWDRYLAIEDARMRRFGDPGCIAVIDLDGLKEINDTEGHAAGDELLQTAATTIRTVVRANDIVARLGGDEFGVLVSNSTARQAAVLVARLELGLEAAHVPASIGVAPFSVAGGFSLAWAQADENMYRRKRERRIRSAA